MLDAQRLTLQEDLIIYNAQDIKQRLQAALADCRTLELDLSQVSQIDTSGLQLLILAKREAGRLDRDLRIVAHSPAVQQAIDFCNLASFFGDPAAVGAHEEM
ncbi:MAG: putative binding protein (contains domain) [Rhodocyclaceae bacterium]|nr:putative binding protein (contains domain) [Rhodocyclaceae bacterium]